MGTVFKKTTTRPVPAGAEFAEKDGKRVARWRVRGKLRTALLTIGADGGPRIATRAATYMAKYRDHAGAVVERATGCRDEQTARQMLAKWEREVEQIKAGTLDAKHLDSARRSAESIRTHLDAYEQSLIAAETSPVYRANLRRAVLRVAAECDFATLADLSREAVERWLAERVAERMSARTRNHYRESLVAFANWCREMGRLREHDLHRVPKADPKSDPRRPRRALTGAELTRLLSVARSRPLADAKTVRRGKNKGKAVAVLSATLIAKLTLLGRERALLYKTFILTGLRANELRTLTVRNLDLTTGAETLQLEARNEKNGAGSTLPLRADLAEELREWIGGKKLMPADRLFTVPAGLLRILNRDLEAAGIPKRDDRGRTVDVHALRTTFCTLLSATGAAPRTTQQAMRHSDIKLTMGVYTDPRLLDIRGAIEKLPALSGHSVAPPVAPTPGGSGQRVSSQGTFSQLSEGTGSRVELVANPCPVNRNAPVTIPVITGASLQQVGLTGFEPATSWSRTKRSTKLSYSPSCLRDD